MRLKIQNEDGDPNKKIQFVNADTGENLPGVLSVTLDLEPGGFPITTVRFCKVQYDLSGETVKC